MTGPQRAGAIGGLILVAAIVLSIVFWKPLFAIVATQLADARADKELATDDAKGRALENQGQAKLADQADKTTTATAAIRGRTNELTLQTKADPTVSTRIPAGELARLRAHDDELCGGKVLACDGRPAPAPGAAPGGPQAVPPLDVGRE